MFKDLTFIFDIDGTLCPIKKEAEHYEDLIPYAHMIDRLRWYHDREIGRTSCRERVLRLV